MDAGNVLREINLAGERLLGLRRSELLGRPLSRLLMDVGCQQFENMVIRARKGLIPQTCKAATQALATSQRSLRSSDAGFDNLLRVLEKWLPSVKPRRAPVLNGPLAQEPHDQSPQFARVQPSSPVHVARHQW